MSKRQRRKDLARGFVDGVHAAGGRVVQPAPVNPYNENSQPYHYRAFERLVTVERDIVERTRPSDLDTIVTTVLRIGGAKV